MQKSFVELMHRRSLFKEGPPPPADNSTETTDPDAAKPTDPNAAEPTEGETTEPAEGEGEKSAGNETKVGDDVPLIDEDIFDG